jgi:hypothetical protein
MFFLHFDPYLDIICRTLPLRFPSTTLPRLPKDTISRSLNGVVCRRAVYFREYRVISESVTEQTKFHQIMFKQPTPIS